MNFMVSFLVKKTFIYILPAIFLLILLMILASIHKEQLIEIDAVSMDFTMKCSSKVSTFLLESLPVEKIQINQFGQFDLMIKECRSLKKNEILFQSTKTPATLTISPHSPLFSSIWLEGKRLVLKEIVAQPGMIANLSLADDFSLILNLSKQTHAAHIELSETFNVILQKCDLKISNNATSEEYLIDRQKAFKIIRHPVNLILEVPAFKSDIVFSFLVPQSYYENNEILLQPEIPADSISFTKVDLNHFNPISSLTSLNIKFPDMNGMKLSWDSSYSVYLKDADLRYFVLKYLGLHLQPLGFQIKLNGKSDKINVGTNINYIQNVMPSILEWLWVQKKITLIVSCLLWLFSTQLAIISLLKR